MKKIFFLLIFFMIPHNVFGLSSDVDINRDSSITVNYFYDDYDFSNVDVKLYCVALVTNDYNYRLSSNFSSYSLNVNDIKTEEEWKVLADTINSYIEEFDILEYSSKKIKNNKIIFSKILPGIYFIKTNNINNGEYSFSFENILVDVPRIDDNGVFDYDVIVNSKVEEYIPSYEVYNPSTYDNIKVYLYIFIGSIIGIILLIVKFYYVKKIYK